ncbi:hypothetical protein [Flavobacterium sp. N1994]|uniref:hypothetical protein n=1 Tax=Flavobacterium sp. N1994 TaxID=2986827 RepID=UPI0022230513|nr:hypothetical protein [Flavobacterium sp. N1994]
MSNIIDFSRLGGYRLEQPTFDKMQSNTFGILDALMGHLRVPNVGNFIVSGCELAAGNIGPGIMYIDGVLCPFAGTTSGTETTATKIKKNVVTSSLSFENGTNPAVFTAINAIVDAAGTALSSFIRIPYNDVVAWSTLVDIPTDLVHDAAYVHTDNNFTNAQVIKLLGIQPGAQVNIKPSWIAPAGAANEVLDKPDGLLITYLKQFTYIHGDLIGDRALVTLSFPDIGTSDYKVIINQVGSGSDYAADGLINYHTREHTSTSFKLALVDRFNSNNQSVKFQIILTPDITN